MRKAIFQLSILVIVAFLIASCSGAEEATLKSALKDKFLIGVAVNPFQTSGEDTASAKIIVQHFNSIVAENCMKSGPIHPEKDVFDFENADRFVEFGEENDMFIIGHTLIWHSQAPRWLFVDDEGNDVSREELIERMKNHISTVVGRYKGRVDGWDVVNEAIEDDGSWRKNKFYEIIGEDYVRLAFEFAHDADPGAELYYNDYNMVKEGKREAVVKLIKTLQEQGITVDGIGIQGHYYMDYPKIEDLEKSIIDFAALGCSVMMTELDVSALPNPWEATAEVSFGADYEAKLNPYPDGLPEDVAAAFNERYFDFFRLFLKHSDKVSRVTMWGVSDAWSWRNNWPIRGRTDYPLLFDRDFQPKPVVNMVIEAAKEKQ
ncbi:MAG: endo-1,4-beta-xylanase [Prolixibacteraceae bacterium]|nr:endo-1,4-beta-xylanase [Prolixibacteraceae bacterium]